MAEYTLTVEDPKDAKLIKQILAKFDSVTIKQCRQIEDASGYTNLPKV